REDVTLQHGDAGREGKSPSHSLPPAVAAAGQSDNSKPIFDTPRRSPPRSRLRSEEAVHRGARSGHAENSSPEFTAETAEIAENPSPEFTAETAEIAENRPRR